jgi:hypothetical protein
LYFEEKVVYGKGGLWIYGERERERERESERDQREIGRDERERVGKGVGLCVL